MSEPAEPQSATPAALSQTQQPATPQDTNPEWLPNRLAEAKASERNRIFSELGVKSPDELKAKLKQLADIEAQSLSEKERAQKMIDELTPKATKLAQLEKTFASVVEAKFSGLNDQQKAAIDAKANGDAEKRWEIMDIMESAGVLNAQPPAVKPASTTPAGAAPPPASPKTTQTPREIYEAKQKTDPMGAALYYQMNSMAINNS